MKNKSLLILMVLFLFSSCTTLRHAPYIDTSETMQLYPGLIKGQVISLLGNPLFVKSGSDVNDEVEWAYEVRHKLIESTGNYLEIRPRKKGRYEDISKPMSTLILVFQEDKLIRWYTEPIGSIASDKKSLRKLIPPSIATILLAIFIAISSDS